MFPVSDKWKEVQKDYLVPLSEIQIDYNVTEPGVQEDAQSTGTPEEIYSRASSVVVDIRTDEAKYATLEHNQWVLDKSSQTLPSSPPLADGFISRSLSGADCIFEEIPTITITFSEVHSYYVPGLTLTWSPVYNEYATRFRITAYNGDTQVATATVEDNTSVECIAWIAMSGYDKIVIEILEWCLPYCRARLLECIIGVRQIYTKVDLVSFNHEQHADLLSGELPKNTIVFELDNSDSRWNPENPTGVEQYLIQRQTLNVKYGFYIDGELEWIRAGRFYMSEWNTPSNGLTATFTARDLLEFCGDIYTGPRSGTLLSVIREALAQSGIEEEDTILDSSLGNISTDFSEDQTDYTCAEVLQMAANAGQCCMWQCRDGVLHIGKVNTTLTDYVIGTMDNGVMNTYAHPEVNLTKELKSVNVNNGMGTAINSENGITQEVQNPLIVSSDVANAVAEWCKDCLKNRKLVSGEFRADPRLDALDKVTVVSKYSSSPVYVTNVKYTYNGAFRGSYEGRVID